MSVNSTSSTRITAKTRRDSKLSEVIIKKPFSSKKSCPIPIRTTKPCIVPKRSRKSEKSESSTESVKSSTESQSLMGNMTEFPQIFRYPKNYRTVSKTDSSSKTIEGEDTSTLDIIPNVEDYGGNLKAKIASKDNGYLEALYSEAVGPSKCQFLFTVPASEIKFEEVNTLEKKIEPSHALKNWEKWLKRKKTIQDYLTKAVSKKPCDLLINRLEVFRQVLEDKMMLTYVQIPKTDKWRGHPYRWKTPASLGPKEDSEYRATKTKMEQGIVPQMEFLGVPVVVQRESKLVCFDAPKSVNVTAVYWESSDYRRYRCRQYKKELKKLKPHAAQFEELAVVGTKVSEKSADKKMSLVDNEVGPILPKIYVTDFDEGFHDNEVVIVSKGQKDSSRQSHCTLVIDNEEIRVQIEPLCTWNVQETCKRCNWVIDFGPNLVGTFTEKCIKVENKGTMTISFEWVLKKFGRNQEIDLVASSKHDPWLFFNKNPGIFIPGQIYYLKFYHQCKTPGIRSETWYLRTKPQMFSDPDDGKFTFSAVDVEEPVNVKIQTLKSYLNKRVGESIVKDLLEYTLLVITSPAYNMHKIEYRSFFLEKDLFEFHNPKYFYDSVEVKQLKDLFSKIPSAKRKEWDFSFNSLLTLTKMSPREIQKDILCKISAHSKALLRPTYVSEVVNEKHWMTYQILCKMTNFMEEDFEYFKSHRQKTRKPFCLTDYGESQFYNTFPMNFYEEEEGSSFETSGDTAVTFLSFKSMFYLKVYCRLTEAMEAIADTLETRKLFEPTKKIPSLKF